MLIKKMKYGGILVKSTIRREGIGTILIDNCKKQNEKLKVCIPVKNKEAKLFFEKNGFKIVSLEEPLSESKEEGLISTGMDVCKNIIKKEMYTLEWEKNNSSKPKLIFFDNDIDESYFNEKEPFDYQCINVKQLLEKEKIKNLEVINIKTYMTFRKKLEKIMNSDKILLYINYNNYYRYIDEQIKEIAKIKKINLKVLICEPFSIENTKKNTIIKEIEKSYKDYETIKINCSLDGIKEDISLNQIFIKRNELLVQNIQKIAENM